MIYIFTDGAVPHNGQKNAQGGIGVYWPQFEKNSLSLAIDTSNPWVESKVTNNICELLAILAAIDAIRDENKCPSGAKKFVIYTDSEYCFNIFSPPNSWAERWKKVGWKSKNGEEVKNKKLIQHIDQILRDVKKEYDYSITLRHCKSHSKPPEDITSFSYFVWHGNKTADTFATSVV